MIHAEQAREMNKQYLMAKREEQVNKTIKWLDKTAESYISSAAKTGKNQVSIPTEKGIDFDIAVEEFCRSGYEARISRDYCYLIVNW
jgi:hypothetical protein